MNDVFLNTNKINQYLPEFRKSKKDRGYTYAEIQRLLDIVDERNRTIILLLASTGMRIGAIPGLRLRNIEKVESAYSDNGIYKVTVYEGFKEEYITYGFRKYFTSQLVEADLKTELRWLLEGHNLKGNDSNYVRVSEKRLQQEYEKAINHLTIDPANRLQREMQTLKVDKSRMDMLEAKIQKLEKKYHR